MANREPLGAWLYGTRVAELTSTRPGEVRLRYTNEALERWPLNTPLLSCSLPLTDHRQQAGVFFKGLLPEGQHLHSLAAEARVPAYDTFGLLARYGKDVAGAAVIALDDPGKRPGDVETYTAEALAEEVASLPQRPLGIHDDSELSLAGLQDKLLLVAVGDHQWGRPIHGRPSTHILKVEDRRYPGMAALEAGCLHLARAAQLTTVSATVVDVAGLPCLIVSRFDRCIDVDGTVARVHQEDVCQAMGLDPDAAQGRGKNEASGGPKLRDVAGLLDRFAADPVGELSRLAAAVAYTVVIGNADAHGKNLSLLHPEPGLVSLAPLYDTVPTVMWPNLRSTAAMSVNGRHDLDAITVDDVVAEAGAWPLDADRARSAAESAIAAVMSAVTHDAVPEDLRRLVADRSERFLNP